MYTADCKFPEANYALNIAEKIIQHITCQENNNVFNKSMFYTARSSHLYALSRYVEVWILLFCMQAEVLLFSLFERDCQVKAEGQRSEKRWQ